MFKFKLPALLVLSLLFTSCRENSRALEHDTSEATIASETGKNNKSRLASDVIAVSKALINGVLYEKPNFESKPITQFDTSQELFLLDTTDIMFVKARLYKDSAEYTGYVSKAILPEGE